MFRTLLASAAFTVVIADAAQALQIFVSIPAGQTLTLEVEANDTIDAVKSFVTEQIGIPTTEQRLVYAGIELLDGRTVADYNIQSGATLQLILPTDTQVGDALSSTSAALQLSSATSVISARVGDRLQVVPGDVTLSSMGGSGAEVQLWTSLAGIGTAGGLSAEGGGVLFGIDRITGGNALLGLYGSYAWLNADAGHVRSPALGLYFGVPFAGGLLLDGHLGFAQPRYDFGGDDFSTKRTMAALKLSGQWQMGAVLLTPGLGIEGYAEAIPAHGAGVAAVSPEAARYWSAAASLRVDSVAPLGSTGLKPYLEASLGRARLGSNLVEWSEFDVGRVAFGVAGTVGPGALSVEVSTGDVLEDVRATRVSVGYGWRF